jgi:NADH-quinone oxidoreductase subunit N
VIGLLLSLSGFFFKLAVFPFHTWAPGVYQKSANQVAVYIATVSKIAAAGVLVRMLSFSGADAPYFIHVLAVLTVISMTIANFAALAQTDLKRLLAYSSIAHAGYILLGIIGGGETGRAGVLFYALSLLLMKLTAFFVIIKGLPGDEDPKIEDLAGLYERSPILALALMVSLFSLAGIPPFVGFTAKFFIFSAAMKSGYFGLVLVAMINVVISLYYYLRVLKAAYVLPVNETAPPLHLSQTARFLAGVLILLMIGGGLYPATFITVADAAAHGLGISF